MRAVLAYLRDPINAVRLGIDTKRIAMAGHSMGGWVTAHTAAQDHELIGVVLISAADMGAIGGQPRERIVALMADNKESLAGVTAESMTDEVIENAKAFRFANTVSGLTQMPLLVLSADDGLAPGTDALVKAIATNGGKKVTSIHVKTDHGWSDHRIQLESTVINWLAGLK
jgi:pimeloyl-ACP methyl ester carboxylesterase